MRGRIVLSSLLVVMLTAFAPASDTAQPRTVEGCIIGINGSFRLSTANGETYLLKGHHSSMFNYNGKQVRITGSVEKQPKGSSGAPPTMKITDIKKVYDSCQF